MADKSPHWSADKMSQPLPSSFSSSFSVARGLWTSTRYGGKPWTLVGEPTFLCQLVSSRFPTDPASAFSSHPLILPPPSSLLPPPFSDSSQPLRAVQLCVASVEWTNQLPPLPLDSIWSSPPAPSAPPATGCSTTRSSWPTGARARPTTRPSALTATSGLWPISPSLRNRLAQL